VLDYCGKTLTGLRFTARHFYSTLGKFWDVYFCFSVECKP